MLFLEALNQRISSAFRTTVISMANLGIRASFCLLGPLVGYGIDAWGLPSSPKRMSKSPDIGRRT